MLELRADFSRRVLMQLLLAAVLAAILIVANAGFIFDFYFRDQRTLAGVIINAAIVALFVLAILKIALNLMRLSREEEALVAFVDLYEKKGALQQSNRVDPDSLIYQRYEAITRLARRQANIDHAALAAGLMASESTRATMPKFVNGILILIGVFGTLVALSIALVGASGLLETGQEIGNMNLIIHGMATASSCTMTAIACYVFLGYFYLRLTDAQTQLLGNIEQVTTVLLLPRRAQDPEGLVQAVGALVDDLRRTVTAIEQTQAGYLQAGRALEETVASLDLRLKQVGHDVGQIRGHLREGFRLPDGREAS